MPGCAGTSKCCSHGEPRLGASWTYLHSRTWRSRRWVRVPSLAGKSGRPGHLSRNRQARLANGEGVAVRRPHRGPRRELVESREVIRPDDVALLRLTRLPTISYLTAHPVKPRISIRSDLIVHARQRNPVWRQFARCRALEN